MGIRGGGATKVIAAPARSFYRTLNQILCVDCLRFRTSPILARLTRNGRLTCNCCGYQGSN